MDSEEMQHFILSWLNREDNLFHSSTFDIIKKQFTSFEPPLLGDVPDHVIERRVKECLGTLLNNKMISTYTTDSGSYNTETNVRILTNPLYYRIEDMGRAFIGHLNEMGVMSFNMHSLNFALLYFNDYGDINLINVSRILQKKVGVEIDPTAMETFLIKKGFCIKVFNMLPSLMHELHLTDSGRKLKEAGSYRSYIEQLRLDNERKAEIEKIQFDFINAQQQNALQQLTLTPLLSRSNTSTIKTNQILIFVFTATLVVYIGQLVVSYCTYQLTNNTTQMQLKIEQLERQIQQNKERTSKPKAVN